MKEGYYVPETYHNLTTKSILVTEFITGKHIDDVHDVPQEHKDRLGELLL